MIGFPSYKPLMIEIVALDFSVQLLQKIKLQKLKICLALFIACIFSVPLKVEKSTFIF